MSEIVKNVQNEFSKRFPEYSTTVFSPGRLNFIGEHTDYNLGFVLPASIDKGIVVVMGKSDGNTSKVYSVDKDEMIEFDIDQPLKKSNYGWANYVLGVIDQLHKEGLRFPNFNCAFGGNIPIGSGLSSSAALENGIGFSLNELFDLELDRMKLIHLSQKAEHEFVGVKCGIMDQFSSMMGKEAMAMKLDCRSLDYHFYPVEFGDYEIVLLNSNVSHNLASSEYNVRRSQCEEGVEIVGKKYPEIGSLRDIDIEMLNSCKSELSEIVYRRCKYIIDENERVNDFVSALESSDFEQCGSILFTAHEAMKTEYEITCPEIDILVDLAKKEKGILGSRMMGGGFGGCTLNLIHKDHKLEFVDRLSKAYFSETKIELSPYNVSIGDGVHLVES
ncbi:MAG: galactokinase [Bacteroidota bacterium]